MKSEEEKLAYKEHRKAYGKKWRELNKEKMQEYKRQYYKANKEKIKEYREKNKESISQKAKRKYQKNKEKKSAYDKAYRKLNAEKIRAYNKEYNKRWHEANKEKSRLYMREHHLRTKYNITLAEYNKGYQERKGLCDICKKHFNRLVVDHDHKTDIFRGFLCHPCNSAIGLFYENEQFLESAKMYLREFSEKLPREEACEI